MSTRFSALLPALILIGIAVTGIAVTPRVYAVDPLCEALFTHSEAELSNIRPDFDHTSKYTIEVKETEVKNQCQSSSCWIYSGTSNTEQKILTTTGKLINLSEEYLISIATRLKAIEALLTPGGHFSPGGSAANVDWLMQNYGAVPDGVWHPRVDFKSPQIAARMRYFLNARIAKFHIEAAQASEPGLKRELLDAAKKDVLSLIESYTGDLPESFTYEGVKYESPNDFAEAMVPKDDRVTIRMAPAEAALPEEMELVLKKIRPRQVKKMTKLIPQNITSRILPIEQIGQKIKEALQRGESVRIGYESVHEFVDDKTGIMSIGAYFIPKGFEPPPSTYREDTGLKSNGHAVEIIGVDVGADGHIIKFKIKNSHGTRVGEAGYYHMYWDYFAAFLSAAYLREPK